MHKKRLIESFGDVLTSELVVLGIPDMYKYMDAELVQELKEVVPYYLGE